MIKGVIYLLGIVFAGLFVFFFSFSNVSSSAPLDDFEVPKVVSGEDLKVRWESPEHAPLVLGWKDSMSSEHKGYFFPKEKRLSILISRVGLGKIPEKLLLIPVGDNLEPLILEVPFDQEEVKVNFEPIQKNEAWFWGITPLDPCPYHHSFHFKDNYMSISARLIHQKSIYFRFRGLFAWKIILAPEDKYEKAIYFLADYQDAVDSIKVEGLKEANDISKVLCHVHHGGHCNFTLETNPQAWGRLNRIFFSLNENFDKYHGCPI